MAKVDAASRNLSALQPLSLSLLPDDGLSFDEAIPTAWLRARLRAFDAEGFELQPAGEGRLKLDLTPLGPVDSLPPVLLRGVAETAIHTDCVRCQSALNLPLKATIETSFFYEQPEKPAHASKSTKRTKGDDKSDKKAKAKGKDKSKTKGKAKKGEPLEDWSQTAFPEPEALGDMSYDGERLDLPAAIEEALLLEVDLNPCCTDTKACDARTQALLDRFNRPALEDPAFQSDPRWAGLARFRDPENEPANPDED